MNTEIMDPSVFSMDALNIPPHATQSEWEGIHRTIMLCRKASRTWLRQSRDYAAERWGADYVADVEIQMELALGLPQPDPKPALNPADKSSAIVTIEGISQSFSLWQRKMSAEIERWDKVRLAKALELIEPIEKQAARIRELLNARK
jgi:hypothetical protein